MAQVGIVVLAWNKLEYTKKCIKSILQNTNFNYFQIIAVNNGSTDGTYEYFEEMRAKYAKVNAFIPVHLSENLGYGGGMNAGTEVALKNGSTHICHISNDVEVQPGWLHPLYECLEKDPSRGLVQPLVLDFENKVQDCGVIVEINSENYLKQEGIDRSIEHLRTIAESERLYLNGCVLLGTKRFFEEVGGFDPAFAPIYHEESDLCLRGHRQGFKMMFCGKSTVKHHVRLTTQDMPEIESLFWEHWELFLKRHKAYICDLAQEIYGEEFNRIEISKFGIDHDLKDTHQKLANDWHKMSPQTQEQMNEFYKSTVHYIGDLINWNNSEYKIGLINHAIEICRENDVESILDVGAGILSDSIRLRNSGLKVTSVDLNCPHYEFGQFRLEDRKITDIECLYVGETLEKYDAVVLLDVIEHIKDIEEFLETYISKIDKYVFMTIPETIPPDEHEKHPMHLLELEGFWQKLPEYMYEKFGFKRIDSMTYIKER